MVNNRNKEKHEKEDVDIHLGLAIDELQATKDLAESVRKENTQLRKEQALGREEVEKISLSLSSSLSRRCFRAVAILWPLFIFFFHKT